MELLITMIWFIGWAFTIGLCFDKKFKAVYFITVPIAILSWPVLLGEYVKVILEES